MGGRRYGRLAAVVALAVLGMAAPARAQRVAIVDFYGESDLRAEASAVTLLIRSQLSGGKAEIVSRADLEAAFVRASVQRAGNVRRLSLEQIRDLLVSTGATVVISGEVSRSGPE